MAELKTNRYGEFAANYAETANAMISALWMNPVFEEVLPVQRCFDARKIILTGNGVGYAAVIAGVTAFKEKSDVMFGVEVMKQTEFNYFNNVENMGIGEPYTPLVLVFCESADDPDALETIEMAKNCGANGVMVAAYGDAFGKIEDGVCLGVDRNENDHYAKAYLSQLITLVSLGCRVGRVRGPLGERDLQQYKEAMQEYVSSCTPYIEAMDVQARDFAQQCKGMLSYDLIADDDRAGAAHLIGVIAARENGIQYNVSDTEEWCHVNYWMLDRTGLPVMIWGDATQKSYSRVIETMSCIYKLERPYLFATDADASDFYGETKCCAIPKAPEGKSWVAGLGNFLPMLLALGYLEIEGTEE